MTKFEKSEYDRRHLGALLDIKKANEGVEIKRLQDLISGTVVTMEPGDVAWVEKITGIQAL